MINSSQSPLTTQHKTNNRDEHRCPQRDSNPRSQHSSSCRLTPYSAGHRTRQIGSYFLVIRPNSVWVCNWSHACCKPQPFHPPCFHQRQVIGKLLSA